MPRQNASILKGIIPARKTVKEARFWNNEQPPRPAGELSRIELASASGHAWFFRTLIHYVPVAIPNQKPANGDVECAGGGVVHFLFG